MIWKIFLIFVFMIEVLDTSTMFVRAGISSQSSIEQFGSYSNDSHDMQKADGYLKLVVESPSHSALPIFAVPSFIVFNFESEITLPEVIIPQLNPPSSTHKRPPIC